MNDDIRVGLLPLYVDLYDRVRPESRKGVEKFLDEACQAIEKKGLQVVSSDVCTLAPHFDRAISEFEKQSVDLLVTLHLAYSPSGESAERLAKTPLPILMLDTTPRFDFGPATDPEQLMYNHGIHGLQDLASVLRRKGRQVAIEAGHLVESDVLDRAVAWARAGKALRRLRTGRVARIGKTFAGMDDFAVAPEVLREKLGPETIHASPKDLVSLVPPVEDEEVAAEIEADRWRFDASAIDHELHVAAVRAGLALRRFIERERLTGITMNFESFDADCGLPTVPFLEVSKAMARGIGYAGENDALCAAFVGALMAAFENVTFTEMFCPDWQRGAVFLSHMGEFNLALAARKPVLLAKHLPYVGTAAPAIAACSPRPGPAVFVNLAPGPDDTFSLILAPVDVLEEPEDSRFREAIRGWIEPRLPLERFLEAYSHAGGTHHAALVLGEQLETLKKLAFLAGLPCEVIGG